LPNQGGFYGRIGDSGSTDQLIKHWCFLGEITGFATFVHRELEFIDLDDKTLPFHFYAEQRGREVDVAQLRVGDTVAVLFAQRDQFVYGNPGIRHEDPAIPKLCAIR
jgi:hypothetical protein